LNPVVGPILFVVKDNHDGTLTISIKGLSVSLYVTKYAVKVQNPLENFPALYMAAYTKANERANAAGTETLTDEQKGRKILNSMLMSMTGTVETPAPMACLYLLRGSAFYRSHDCVPLYLGSAINVMIKNADVEVVLQPDGTRENFNNSNQLADYQCRPEELAAVSMYDFAMLYVKKKGIGRKAIGRFTDGSFFVLPPCHVLKRFV
jgi:hypothetical protein